MSVKVISKTGTELTIELKLNISGCGSMLKAEEAIQDSLNQIGCITTEEVLKRFDTDGSPIKIGSTKLTSKGQ